MEMADAMVLGGFREAGYKYVCIDVCNSISYVRVFFHKKSEHYNVTTIILYEAVIRVVTQPPKLGRTLRDDPNKCYKGEHHNNGSELIVGFAVALLPPYSIDSGSKS